MDKFGEWFRSLSLRDGIMFTGGVILALGVLVVGREIYNSQTPVPYQSAGITASWIPPTVRHWSPTIDQMAKKYDIDPNLVAIIMTMESGGDPKAKSGAGAVGLMQVTPLTAEDIAARRLKTPVKKYDLTNPTTNIEFGVAYLAYVRGLFGTVSQGPSWTNTVELIGAGYNGGPGAAESLEAGKGLTDTQTVVYSRDAFNMWRERHSSDSPTFDRWKERGGSLLLQNAQTDLSK
ncbi:MAG TPA: transglycosylase SLT domain-containing protein [Candidatus Saccharimonadales bacterium]|jgi:soluble lytic murein transglycosylase-like protein